MNRTERSEYEHGDRGSGDRRSWRQEAYGHDSFQGLADTDRKGQLMRTFDEMTRPVWVAGRWCNVWADGSVIPALSGSDHEDDESGEEEESGATGEGEESTEDGAQDAEQPATKSRIKALSNEAAKYRKQRNGARTERDMALAELAFVKAIGNRFQDRDAAWKLVDKSTITVGKGGSVAGVEQAIEALAEANPFLLTGDEEPDDTDDGDPFAVGPRATSRRFNGKRKPSSNGLDRAALQAKFPALRRLG